jgi:hypothetical protein
LKSSIHPSGSSGSDPALRKYSSFRLKTVERDEAGVPSLSAVMVAASSSGYPDRSADPARQPSFDACGGNADFAALSGDRCTCLIVPQVCVAS